jgi:hypothetical protein
VEILTEKWKMDLHVAEQKHIILIDFYGFDGMFHDQKKTTTRKCIFQNKFQFSDFIFGWLTGIKRIFLAYFQILKKRVLSALCLSICLSVRLSVPLLLFMGLTDWGRLWLNR